MSRLNRPVYSGQINPPGKDYAVACETRFAQTRKLASLKQGRLRTLRLYPPLDARPLRPFQESSAFFWDCRY